MKKMKNLKNMMKDKKNLMLIIGAGAMSMMAGMIVGMVKEKMKSMDTCCIIDEL